MGSYYLDQHHRHCFRRRLSQNHIAMKNDPMDSDGLVCDFYQFQILVEISSNYSPANETNNAIKEPFRIKITHKSPNQKSTFSLSRE